MPLDLSPPDIPEPGLLETVLRYGLFCGAIFQLICILAIIFPKNKGQEIVWKESDAQEVKSTELVKKPKMPSVTLGKKQKKETKKKR